MQMSKYFFILRDDAKRALVEYDSVPEIQALYQNKPFLTIHMSLKERIEFNKFNKKTTINKPMQPSMNMMPQNPPMGQNPNMAPMNMGQMPPMGMGRPHQQQMPPMKNFPQNGYFPQQSMPMNPEFQNNPNYRKI